MKHKLKVFLTVFLLSSTVLVHAELAECQRTGYTQCSVDKPCHAIAYSRGGMCIKLNNIAKGSQFICEKSGFAAIDKMDYASAQELGLSLIQSDVNHFEINAEQINQPAAVVMFGIYNSYDMPDKFTIICTHKTA